MYQFKSKTLTCTVRASEQFLSATHHGATVQKAPSASDHFLSKTNVQFTLSGRVLTNLAETEVLTTLTKSKANFPQIFLLFFSLGYNQRPTKEPTVKLFKAQHDAPSKLV